MSTKDFVTGMDSNARKAPRRVAFITRRTSAQVKVADEETLVLLKRFSANPDIEKAKANLIKRAQKVEESSLRILMGSIYYPTGLM